MADELLSPQEISPVPDSVSEHLDSVESVADCLSIASRDLHSTEQSLALVDSLPTPLSPPCHAADPAAGFGGSLARMTIPKNPLPACTIAPVIHIGSELHLPGSSSSAFRPFIIQTTLSPARSIISSSQNATTVASSLISKHVEKLIVPQASGFPLLQQKSPTQSPSRPIFLGESCTNEDEDGRTTASAPPCTPVPESHQQPQSPFRNRHPIKKIDLLAMSRSRQSDRAENARRDGRNSGLSLPTWRGLGNHSSLRMSLQSSNLPSNDSRVSPERAVNGTSSTSSPNVDVVSVDDQPDPSKCTFSIQFHDFTPAQQMMKCSLCGFVTNNQRFYRRHRRLHSRQYQPNLIHCSLCNYSTSQIRKMREHTVTSHHLSHPHLFTTSSHNFNTPSALPESAHRPPGQGQMFIGTGSIFHPVTSRPINIPVGAAAATTTISSASTLGLPTYIPAPPEHHIQVNTHAGLQHPPRGTAMLGNYAPSDTEHMANFRVMSPPHTNHNSCVTSSNLFLQAARNFTQESHAPLSSNSSVPAVEETYNYRQLWNSGSNCINSNHSLTGTSFGKVKVEPRAVATNLVSGARNVHDAPSSTQKERSARSPHRQSETLDSESGMDISSDDPASSPQAGGGRSRVDERISTETNHTDITTQVDGSTFGTQYSVPFIKIEFPPHTESCSLLTHSVRGRSDQGIQCEIISVSGLSHRQGRTQSETVSSAGGSAHIETRCCFCGISFDDEVLYSIHIGCHSHTNPFMCNVCGKQCHNKYGFYSHIMRGHQARPNT
ncbi:unnamed protein product [Candidula unifasciata]|uniref:C2H2-type domain-containing protein n=1 Tax=Candidula unifasciata TaxID=100452 RepID=A0A8S4A2G5_9EUPU|nr:unnamed protein product [Candidula unifasciata]